MTESEHAELRAQKRRQAWQVGLFLAGVAAATVLVFRFVHAEQVAFRAGENALERGDFATASAELERAVAGKVASPRARFDLARSYMALGRRPEAIARFEQIARAEPGNRYVLEPLLGLYEATSQPATAIALLEKTGPRETLATPDLVRLGDLYRWTGRSEDAAACYRLAADRQPNDVETQLRLGIVLVSLGQNAAAEPLLSRVLALAPQQKLAHLYRARAAVHEGRFAEAVTDYRAVLSK